jgi:DNA-binding NtrC family response regulator
MAQEIEIAVIDDDPSICELFNEALAGEYTVRTYEDGETGLEGIRETPPDILILDLRLPGKGGLEVLEVVQDEFPDIEVVMVTAHKDVDSAVKAMKLGAFDYIVKPFDLDEIKVIIDKVLESQQLQKEVEQLRSEYGGSHEHTPLVGDSDALEVIREHIERVADNDTSVLVRGESGTGKEVVANKIHYDSPRGDGPLIAVNCAGIPDNLLESELFGHKKGAFTGADQDKKGKVELADGGTLLLDEIGAMPLEMQAKLLRVLEEKQITPVGGEEPREIDFRLVSATSSDLESMIEEGEFREDLFYRINVFEIEIPPLRERIEDVEPLCEYFLDEINQKLDSRVNEISDEAMALLKKHDWPGNVRELRNALESAVVVADGDVLAPEDFDLFSGFSRGEDSVEVHAGMSFEDAEAILIEKTLDAYDGNITRSAEQLGVTRKTLRNKRDEYDIDVGNN